MKTFIAVFMFILLATAASAGCKLTDIEIKQSDWRKSRVPGFVEMIGEIVNHCQENIGVKLKFTFRDADSKVVGVTDLVVSTNVKANSSAAFSSVTSAIYPDASVVAKMTTEVDDIHQFKDK